MNIFEMPPLQRSNFPDDETFEKAVASQRRRESESDDREIDISGLDKIEVLLALYHAAEKMGLGFLQADLSDDEVRDFIAQEQSSHFPQGSRQASKFPYVDYLGGKPLKVDLSSDVLDGRLYDRDQGHGAARRVVETLRTPATVTLTDNVLRNRVIAILDRVLVNDFRYDPEMNYSIGSQQGALAQFRARFIEALETL
jgi:transglutaminase-like putative cysteine protease